MKSDSLFYLANSGEAKKKAWEYRAAVIRLGAALFKIVESYGATKASTHDTMMLLRGVILPKPLDGWTKPDSNGLSRPLKTKANADLLRHFTPDGYYTLKEHPELAAFSDWLKCPCGYSYTQGPNISGSTRIGSLFRPIQVVWYSEHGPVGVVLPNVAKERAEAVAAGKTVKDNVLDWKPPRGLKCILSEEWDLMAAKHKARSKS